MKRILIVDDNPHLVSFLEKKLSDDGHEVVTASTGMSAVKALADYTPDIIFIDYFLPNLDGDKLCQIIRKMDHLKNAYLVVMSAAASELKLDPSGIGANALIAKGTFQETAKHFSSIIADTETPGSDKSGHIKMGIDSVFPRQMTIELLEKYRHLQTVLDSISEGIVEIYCGQIVYANPTASKILGKPQEQLLAVHPPALFDDPARPQLESLISSRPSDVSPFDWIGPIQLEDRILSIKKLPFQGDPDTILLLMTDITGRVHTEKALQDYRDHLESLVQERTADLNRANEMLQQSQKMEAIGTLAGGIAHDFNNILGAMIGYTEMAQIETLPDKRQHCLNQALHICNRAKDMVTQILTFSRQQKQEKKLVSVGPIIREGIKLLRSSLPVTIQITERITKESTVLLADLTQIQQVLMNLCTNSAHAMRERGGHLEVRLVRERIDPMGMPHPLSLEAGNYAKLTVSDTGQGIDASIMNRIFDPFFTTKGPGEGTGLGLSVVYGIVRDHGGAIDVSSKPGKGTTFDVYLPLIETVEPVKEKTSDLVPRGSERILFVDNETMLVEVGSSMLKSLGYLVTPKSSGVEALEQFRLRPQDFDLVITDMTMPAMRGDELATELLKIRPDIPIILCTGFSDMISEEKAKCLGIRQFIMKPLFKKNLAQVVREVLDGG